MAMCGSRATCRAVETSSHWTSNSRCRKSSAARSGPADASAPVEGSHAAHHHGDELALPAGPCLFEDPLQITFARIEPDATRCACARKPDSTHERPGQACFGRSQAIKLGEEGLIRGGIGRRAHDDGYPRATPGRWRDARSKQLDHARAGHVL